MPKSLQSKKSDTSSIKRFNNGHKTLGAPESKFLTEIYDKTALQKDHFHATSYLLRKPRNPCLGELTSREDAEFLLPISSTISQALETENFKEADLKSRTVVSEDTSTATIRFLTDIGKVDALKQRRQVVNAELEQMRKTIKHQQLCMSLMGGESTHPALQRTTTKSMDYK